MTSPPVPGRTADTAEEPLWESCPGCIEHFYGEPRLVHAFASVGIEHGKSTWEMAESYFDEFHRSGHKDRIRRGAE